MRSEPFSERRANMQSAQAARRLNGAPRIAEMRINDASFERKDLISGLRLVADTSELRLAKSGSDTTSM
jgi:hypothetical protein